TRWPRDWSSDVCSSDLSSHSGTEYEPTTEVSRTRWSLLVAGMRGHGQDVGAGAMGEWRERHVEPPARADGRQEPAIDPVDHRAEIGRASCRERGGSAGD